MELTIVLGAFGGLSSVALTAAVSNAGGLGSFGLYGYRAGTRTHRQTTAHSARGWHRWAEPENSLIGLVALLPQLVDAIDVPVIAAGGIADARGVAAALTLGASAAQLGTAFLVCTESAISDAHRSRILSAVSTDSESTVLTRFFSGRIARGIPNRILRELESSGTAPAPFPVQNWLTAHVRAEAARRGDSELMSLWAGQAAALVRQRDAAELVGALARGTDALLP